VLRDTVVELHHEVLEEAASVRPRASLRLAGPSAAKASRAKRPRSSARKAGAPRR
jgi:hypothetical protein